MAHPVITPAIGNEVLFVKMLTSPEVSAPIANCIHPISAEAVPAFLLNGAIESAEALGKVKPWQLKKTSIKNMVDNSPIKWNIVPRNNVKPARL